MITTGGVITIGGMITTGGVATTVAGRTVAGATAGGGTAVGHTVAGGTVDGDTNPRVLTSVRGVPWMTSADVRLFTVESRVRNAFTIPPCRGVSPRCGELGRAPAIP
jgi:hypothetical protein